MTEDQKRAVIAEGVALLAQRKLTPTDFAVLTAIVEGLPPGALQTTLTRHEIARRSNCSISSVSQATKRLEELGLIIVHRNYQIEIVHGVPRPSRRANSYEFMPATAFLTTGNQNLSDLEKEAVRTLRAVDNRPVIPIFHRILTPGDIPLPPRCRFPRPRYPLAARMH